MHMRDGADSVGKDLEDFAFGEPILQSHVHHIDDTSTLHILHEYIDLVTLVSGKFGSCRFNEIDNVTMTAKQFLCAWTQNTAGM